MKNYSLILAILLLAAQFVIAQDRPPLRNRTYIISVTDSDFQSVKGYLFNITDTTLKIGYWPVTFANPAASKDNYKEINYKQISELELKRNHGAGRGAWKGAVIGVLIGVAAGYIEGDDPEEDLFGMKFTMTATEKAIQYGAICGAAGTGIGAIVGASVRKKFIIGGNKERFDEMKANVLTKVYGNFNTR